MPTKAITVAGTIVAISASLPATYDSSGFAALSYTTIGEVTDVGNFGKDYTLVTHNPVNDRKTYKCFKITNQDASDAYFTGKVMSFMTNIGGPNSILGGEIKVEIDSDVVETT